jgi:hypothetical protein
MLEKFKMAFYRFVTRWLALVDVPNEKMMIKFMAPRMDFWPD